MAHLIFLFYALPIKIKLRDLSKFGPLTITGLQLSKLGQAVIGCKTILFHYGWQLNLTIEPNYKVASFWIGYSHCIWHYYLTIP